MCSVVKRVWWHHRQLRLLLAQSATQFRQAQALDRPEHPSRVLMRQVVRSSARAGSRVTAKPRIRAMTAILIISG